ncbi:MAG: hypothetical protein ACSLFQ_06810 [Thermoanaerobaculia bacterium]
MQIAKIVKRRVGPVLGLHGFVATPGLVFSLEQPTGLRWHIIFDSFRYTETFEIRLSVSAAAIDKLGTGYNVSYFTWTGVSSASRSFPRGTPEQIERICALFLARLEDEVLVYFRQFVDVASLADATPDLLDRYKAELYFLAGERVRAREWLVRYLARLTAEGYSVTDIARAEESMACIRDA